MSDGAERSEKNVGYGRGSVDPRGRVVAAARRLFFAEGFAGVTVARLAAEASTSKSTIYKYFGDMPGVLEAVAEAEAEGAPILERETFDSAARFADHLVGIGAALIELIESPEKVQFDRLVQEQARSHPDLARVYYDAIYAGSLRRLGQVLSSGQQLSYLRSDLSADRLAEQLLMMWQGVAGVKLRLGLDPGAAPSARTRSAEAVRTLMGGAPPD